MRGPCIRLALPDELRTGRQGLNVLDILLSKSNSVATVKMYGSMERYCRNELSSLWRLLKEQCI